MKQKLSRISSPWRRLGITILVNSLVFFDHFTSPRAQIHWIGTHRRRPRLERRLIILLFVCAMILLEEREYVIWSAIWGGLTSIFIIVHTVYRLIPHKQYPWVKT